MSPPILIGLSILAAGLFLIRVLLWRIGNGSYDMATAFLVWQSDLIDHGRWHALREPVGMYFPAYYDLTTITSYLDGYMSRVGQVKLVSFCFDIVAAIAAYVLAGEMLNRKPGQGPPSGQLVAPFTILAGPTVILNGAVWGQCDIVFTSFLIFCVAAVIAEHGALAALLFGIALAFKLQAVFLAPFIFAMLLAHRIRWRHLLLVPVGWMIAMIPPLLNGASLFHYLLQPKGQVGAFESLALHIGNPWAFTQWAGLSDHAGHRVGLILTAVLVAAIGRWGSSERFRSPMNTCALAAFSTLALPYFMPHMHDRYFFTAELLLCILSCADIAFVLPAALVLLASLLEYGEYFTDFPRHPVLFIALLANTSALWLTFQHIRYRLRSEASEQMEPVAGRSASSMGTS